MLIFHILIPLLLNNCGTLAWHQYQSQSHHENQKDTSEIESFWLLLKKDPTPHAQDAEPKPL